MQVEERGGRLKDGFVKQPGFRAKLAEWRFTLREMTADMRDRRIWAVILGLVLLVAVAGPFYTLDNLSLAGRVIYWGLVGVPATLMMWAINRLVAIICPQHWPGAAIGAIAGVLGILPLMLLVTASMWMAGLSLPASGFLGLLPYVAPTVIGISVLVHLLLPAPDGKQPPAGQATATGLFARLPPELGRDIIAVQAQDHYVSVSTTKGSSLILMRMSDATEDLAQLAGMQIHRSWWVNMRHVTGLEKPETGTTKLILRNGARVPVPKARLAEVKRAIAAHALDTTAKV
jgi:hypothetical protein